MMNLKELFQMQRQLDQHIEEKHPRENGEDRLAKKILALQVELGELANEQRSWKFWSHDQEPRTVIYNNVGLKKVKTNPLLEEYVDCLHFILSIGLELKAEKLVVWSVQESESIIDMFNRVFMQISVIQSCIESRATIMQTHYSILVDLFVELGEMLGFTWEQIEEAYMSKNAVNHARQENGY